MHNCRTILLAVTDEGISSGSTQYGTCDGREATDDSSRFSDIVTNVIEILLSARSRFYKLYHLSLSLSICNFSSFFLMFSSLGNDMRTWLRHANYRV